MWILVKVTIENEQIKVSSFVNLMQMEAISLAFLHLSISRTYEK